MTTKKYLDKRIDNVGKQLLHHRKELMSCREYIEDVEGDCISVRYSITNHILPRLNDLAEAVKTHAHAPPREPRMFFEVYLSSGNVVVMVEAERVSESGGWVVFETISGGVAAKFKKEDAVGWNKTEVGDD